MATRSPIDRHPAPFDDDFSTPVGDDLEEGDRDVIIATSSNGTTRAMASNDVERTMRRTTTTTSEATNAVDERAPTTRVIDVVRRGGANGTTTTTTTTMRANEDTATRARALATTTTTTTTTRTMVKKPYESLDVGEKLETNEKRLFETQATLVRERLKREVTENILRETAKSLSAVRKAALQGQMVEQTGGALPGSVEYQNEVLTTRVRELTQKMMDLQGQHGDKEGELASLRRLLQQRENEFDLIGERPVSIHVDIKEFSDADQEVLIDQTRKVLQQARQQAEAVNELRQLDRQRTRALGDLVLTMEARRKELQDKLREAGIAEEYDDDRVANAAKNGYGADIEPGVSYEGPVSSPTGRSFYVTRTANFWDRFYGVQI